MRLSLLSFGLLCLSIGAGAQRHNTVKRLDDEFVPPTSSSSSSLPKPASSASTIRIGPRIIPTAQVNCFPFGTATLNGTTPPNVSLDDWRCPNEIQYGFMGFSLPLEATSCDDPSKQYDSISDQMWRMKSQFNATMVRIYAPQCRDKSIWLTLLKAGITHNMAVLPMVWWGFQTNQSEWRATADSIVATLEDPIYGPIAPYVFHSIAFGSEPIGDGVDGGITDFIKSLRDFKKKIEPFGIPVTISEDWDRPGILSNSNWTGLTGNGKIIESVIDLVHAHIMPYYHADLFPTAAAIWPYFEQYIPFLSTYLPGKPILISQTLWASQSGGSHDRGFGNPGENIGNFTQYWSTLQSAQSCQFFKQYRVGWFVHAYDDSQETGLGMIDSKGEAKMDFDPVPC